MSPCCHVVAQVCLFTQLPGSRMPCLSVLRHSNLMHLLNPSVVIGWAQMCLFPCLPRQHHGITVQGYLFTYLASTWWCMQDRLQV